MANSLIPAFNQIRLAGQFVTTSGLRVQVANDNTLMVRDSGNFANIQQLVAASGTLAALIAGSSAGVSQLNSLSGNINIIGTGSVISVTQSGQTIYISGNNNDARNISGNLAALSGNLTLSGQALTTLIQSTATNISGSINATGGLLSSSIAALSGSLVATGGVLTNLVIGLSGQLNANNYLSYINATGFLTGVVTGADNMYVNFPRTFSAIPRVTLTMDTNGSTNIFYFCGTAQRSTTGFQALFSDVVLETGLSLSVWAAI